MKRHGLLLLAIIFGGLLLPRLVGAHSATGPCADCHTMHNSQNGDMENPAGAQPYLLKLTCIGCHALRNNGANGRAASGVAAPQVLPLNPAVSVGISGGYFNVDGGANDAKTHNVADLGAAPDSILLANLATTSPGGSFDLKISPIVPRLSCISCHDPSIGHAPAGSPRTGTSTSSYRMLHGAQYVIGTGDVDFEAGIGRNQYDAASMNLFCATCHGLFHGTGPGGTGSSGAWIRHPTEVTTTPGNGNGTSYEGTDKMVPVGDAGPGKTNLVMCLSCHRPHGSDNPDLLRFKYDGTANLAGDITASQGCETCHGTK